MRLYFAYGSNMDEEQMACRCSGSRVLGKAVLPGYAFRINQRGYATVVSDASCETYGLLWDLEPHHEEALDWYEGCDSGFYEKVFCTVRDETGKKQDVLVYIDRNHIRVGTSNVNYLERIVVAARKWAFPASYITMLACWPEQRNFQEIRRFCNWLEQDTATADSPGGVGKATADWHQKCPIDLRREGAFWLEEKQDELIHHTLTVFAHHQELEGNSDADQRKNFDAFLLETIVNATVDFIEDLIQRDQG